MQRIEIRNFGPLKEISLDVSDFMVLIGPQASGKSTIAKLVFFFRSLRGELQQSIGKGVESALPSFCALATKKFKKVFGHGVSNAETSIRFSYTDNLVLCYKAEAGQEAELQFIGAGAKAVFLDLVNNYQAYLALEKKYSAQIAEDLTFDGSAAQIHQQQQLAQANNNYRSAVDHMFGGALGRHMYFPDGRNFLGNFLKEHLENALFELRAAHAFDGSEADGKLAFLMGGFLDWLTLVVRPAFQGKSIQEVISAKGQDNNREDFQLLYAIMQQILRGEFRFEQDGSMLFQVNNGGIPQWVALNFASSGQQEAVFLLIGFFYLLIHNISGFLAIEEPEAHLFPEAQKAMVEAIALLTNQTKSQTIVTTHSPYILGAFSNLLYAHKVGKQHSKEVAQEVNPLLWISKERFQAFLLLTVMRRA